MPYMNTKTWQPLQNGETIRDFRKQEWTFVETTRVQGQGRSGKVLVRDEFDRVREFYGFVFPEIEWWDGE